MPRQSLFGEGLEERIRVELLDVVHAGFDPFAGEEHHGAGHGRYAGGVADGLHAGLFEGLLVRAVVIYIIGKGFALFVDCLLYTSDAADD